MATEELTVLARIRAKKGKETEVLRVISALLKPTRKEDGCINYDLHCSKDDSTLFFLYETWKSREALDEHLNTPYLQDFLSKAPDLLAEDVDLTFWDLVD
jgi:quinol monooxygenase YgiN